VFTLYEGGIYTHCSLKATSGPMTPLIFVVVLLRAWAILSIADCLQLMS